MKQSKNRYKKRTLYDRNTLRIEFGIRKGCDFKSRDTLKTWDNREIRIMCNGYIAFTTVIQSHFCKLKKKYRTNHCWGYNPVSTYAQRSLITRIRDNFVRKHSSGVRKRLSNSPLSPRQITCKIFNYSNNFIVQKRYQFSWLIKELLEVNFFLRK